MGWLESKNQLLAAEGASVAAMVSVDDNDCQGRLLYATSLVAR